MINLIIILGGPGSGKGTQSQRIIQKYPEITHLSVGNLLRQEAVKNTVEAKIISEYLNKGRILPSDLTLKILGEYFKQKKTLKDQYIIIDGFPRNLDNLFAFQCLLKDFNKTSEQMRVTQVIYLSCDEEHLRQRLLNRKQQRSDDIDSIIQQRLTTFKEENYPVIDYLKNNYPFIEINAALTIKDIWKTIKKILF